MKTTNWYLLNSSQINNFPTVSKIHPEFPGCSSRQSFGRDPQSLDWSFHRSGRNQEKAFSNNWFFSCSYWTILNLHPLCHINYLTHFSISSFALLTWRSPIRWSFLASLNVSHSDLESRVSCMLTYSHFFVRDIWQNWILLF